MQSLLSLLALLALSWFSAAANAATAWPQFRGPDGQGDAGAGELPLKWSETEGVVWKTPIPGRGWSSPVYANDRIWLTAAELTEADPEKRAELLKTVEKQPLADEFIAYASMKLVAVELDAATGKLLRRVELFEVESPTPIHGLNSYASPTPVLEGGRCYCHFGTFGTACVDTETGEVLWRRTLPIEHVVGPGSSPVLHAGKLIIPCDGADRQFIAALDADTGEPAWQVDRPPIRNKNPDNRKAFSTPLVITVDGRDQVVIPGAQWFVAYDPATGEEIWRVDHGPGYSNVARPVFDGRLLYLNTGFNKPQLWAVRPDGTGDVTETHVLWRQPQQVPAMSSPVCHEGRIYMISDGGVASCLDAETGESIWRERVPGKYSASPLVGGGRMYFSNHEGRTTVISAGPKFEVLAQNDLAGMLMASPAVVDGDLLLRTDSHLYRIGKSAPAAAAGQ